MPSRAQEFLSRFKQPDRLFSPAPIWWWSGEKLQIDTLRRQMDRLAAMGIHNVVVLNLAPSGTLFGCDADDPPFMSEEWWAIFRQVCAHARSIGMFVWFYDQIGFSGASFQADLAAAHPDCIAEQLNSVFADGTGELTAACPSAAVPIAAYVIPLEGGAATYLDPSTRSVRVQRPSRLRIVYTLSQGYDLFSAPACQRLLDTVHRQFQRRLPEHLGTAILGSFQDELPDLPTWGRTFAQSFEQKNGYSLLGVLHHLFEPGDAQSRRTRLHYHAHRADLAEEAFFKPFFQWHEQHGLQCGFDQQSPAREARVLGCVHKYADYVQTHRWYAIPGSDLHGNGKLHASMAYMYDRRRVWIEGFHSTGWGGTIADTFDWLLPYLRAGANFYNPHAVYYSMREGWWEWAPPSTCWRQPYARHYQSFAEMIARLTKLLSVGVQQAEVGVLFPSSTVQAESGPVEHLAQAAAADGALDQIIGSMRWHQAKLGLLDRWAVDFHILDEATVQSAAVKDGRLEHREVLFHTMILPQVTVLHDQTLNKLVEFGQAGGQILAVGADCIETPGGKSVRVSSLRGGRLVESAERLGDWLPKSPWPVPVLHRRLDDLHVLFVPAVGGMAGMATEVKWDHWFAPMEHTTIVPGRYLQSADIHLPATARDVWRFDPWEGSCQPFAPGTRLDFEGAPFAVLVWSDKDTPAALLEDHPKKETQLELAEKWSCQYLPAITPELDDTHNPPLPHTTEFVWNGGEIVRAGFGVRAWRNGTEPIVYSPKFGILQDKIHTLTLGPKGYVPEEFIDLGKLAKDQLVTIHTGVVSDTDRPAVLAIGANAQKAAAVGGRTFEEAGSDYLWMTPVRLAAGENKIELRLTARREGSVRLFWCLLDPQQAAAFRRPERIGPPSPVSAGSMLVYRKPFDVHEPQAGGRIKISIAAMAGVYLDGQLLGRLGGFDPYRPQMRGQTFAIPPLPPGRHELQVEVIQPQRAAPLTVDGPIMSDATWTVNQQPVAIHDRQEADAAAWMLHRRGHALLGGTGVLDLPLMPPGERAIAQELSWIIPPGATAMRLPLAGDAIGAITIDGVRQEISATIPLPPNAKQAVLNITSRDLGGGLLLGPVTYDFGIGSLNIGSWLDQGLRSFSGAIRMRQTVKLERADEIRLDLGRVRGTAEAVLNGRPAGVRCMSPYRFDLTAQAHNGANELELVVTNTLANHLSTWSPTRCWSPDQLECGVFGPVTITTLTTKRDEHA